MTYSARTYEIVEEQLKTRKLDDEARLPIALGAAIEVQALALAGQGKRSEAIMTLQREIEQYKGTSIIMRLNKNMNLLSLEGQPAFPIESTGMAGTEDLARRAQGQAGRAVPVGALVRRLQDAGTDPRRAGQQVQELRHHRDRADAAIRLRRKAKAGRPGRGARLHRTGPRRVLSVDEDGVRAGQRRAST